MHSGLRYEVLYVFLFPAGRQPLPESPLQRKTPRRTYVFWVVRGDAHHPVKRHVDLVLAGTLESEESLLVRLPEVLVVGLVPLAEGAHGMMRGI